MCQPLVDSGKRIYITTLIPIRIRSMFVCVYECHILSFERRQTIAKSAYEMWMNLPTKMKAVERRSLAWLSTATERLWHSPRWLHILRTRMKFEYTFIFISMTRKCEEGHPARMPLKRTPATIERHTPTNASSFFSLFDARKQTGIYTKIDAAQSVHAYIAFRINESTFAACKCSFNVGRCLLNIIFVC